MRKYWRVGLFIFAVLSCIFMLVYKHKYENLYSLLNFFKFPSAENITSLHKLSNQLRLNIEEILNAHGWIEIFHGIYAYSPHFIYKSVILLGYTTLPAKELEYMSCRLWYENHTITSSVKSTFKISLLDTQAPSVFYMTCSSDFEFGLPYAVTLEKGGSSSSLPVFPKQIHTGSYTVCMKPLPSIFFDSYKILEFIIYHSHIGIKHFIFYYATISSTTKEMLLDIASKCGIYLELLPWIPPPGFKHDILKLESHAIDCMFHVSATNHSNFLFLLDLDHYVYLEEKSHIEKLIHNNSPFDFLQLQKKIFCSEYPKSIFARDLKVHFRTLSKTKVHPEIHQNMNVIYNISQIKITMKRHGGFKNWLLTKNMPNYNIVKESSGAIFSYTKCGANFKNTVYTENDKMWKFKNMFYRDCAYLLSKQSGFIED